MKKLLISTALAGSLSLGGCATTGGVTGGSFTSGVFSPEQIAQVQKAAVAICGFLPVVQTVEQIIVATAVPAGLPITTIANQIGNAICTAVTARSVRLGSTQPTVAGVPVHGSFVGKSSSRRGAVVNGVQIHGSFVR